MLILTQLELHNRRVIGKPQKFSLFRFIQVHCGGVVYLCSALMCSAFMNIVSLF